MVRISYIKGMMNIEISAKNISLTAETKETIAKKFASLKKFLSLSPSSRLHIHFILTTGEHHRKGNIFAIDARLYVGHKVLKANDTGENILILSDKAKEQIERRLLKEQEIKKAATRQMRRSVRKLRGKE